MISILLDYWWITAPVGAVIAFYSLRFWADRKLESWATDILTETQSDFASGNVEIHSVSMTGTTEVGDETATLYDIDATITPSERMTQWEGSDLFLRGIDEEGDEDPMRVGEVRRLKKWNGSSFEAIKRRAKLEGVERLLLTVRFAGAPGPVRFNYNFACFGPMFDLPEVESEVLATS